MLKDRYGNHVDTHSKTALEAYSRGLDLHLSANVGSLDAIEEAIAADPEFSLAHLAKAVGLYTRGSGRQAREALAIAEVRAENCTDYGRGQMDVLGAAMSGQPSLAYERARTHLRDHPCDPLVADACIGVFSLIGFSGREGREQENLALAHALAPSFGDDWFFLAQLAFSEMEAGNLATAEPIIERAMLLAPKHAHGAHYKAHLYYETGESDAGRAYLADWMADYPANGLMHGHNTWHLALWALAAGEADEMWSLADNLVGPGGSSGPGLNILTDTAALYYRAEIAGVPVAPERWKALSQYATKIFPKPGIAFADFHAALAHAIAGDGAALAKITHGAKGPAADVVTALAKTFDAIARQDWMGAKSELAPILATHERIGGSRAQRDLLEYTYAHVLMRLGKTEIAGARLRKYRPATDYSGAVVGLHGQH